MASPAVVLSYQGYLTPEGKGRVLLNIYNRPTVCREFAEVSELRHFLSLLEGRSHVHYDIDKDEIILFPSAEFIEKSKTANAAAEQFTAERKNAADSGPSEEDEKARLRKAREFYEGRLLSDEEWEAFWAEHRKQ